MAMKYRETDYLYASARIRALEGRLCGTERLLHMCEAKSAADVMARLSEHGFETVREGDGNEGPVLREDTLLSVLRQGFREIEEMGGRDAVAFLRYPYDCNNIKAVIKCFSRGIQPEGLLLDGLGTLDVEAVKTAFAEKRYECFPPHLAAAIPVAEREFAESGNPQRVDLILDGACYTDMRAAAERSGMDYACRLVRAKIDLTNLISCVRLIRMKAGAAAGAFLSETLIEGGLLPRELFEEAFGEGESELAERLAYTPYASLCVCLDGETPLHTLEKQADDLRMEVAADAKYLPFGAEVMIGYVMALETQVMNIRIILAGKDAGLPSDVIRERLRKSYV